MRREGGILGEGSRRIGVESLRDLGSLVGRVLRSSAIAGVSLYLDLLQRSLVTPEAADALGMELSKRLGRGR
jgi:hypothetical protein